MELDLEDRTVVLTGATGGIGQSICRAFLSEGAAVIPFYRNETKMDQLHQWLVDEGQAVENLFPVLVDLQSSESIASAVGTIVQRHKQIDILVNTAGSSMECPFLLMEEDVWDAQIDINLSAIVRVIRPVLKQMYIAKRGAIVNVSSIVGEKFGRGVGAYATAKAALNRITEVLAQEVGPKGIRVNAVCPGLIETKMSSAIRSRPRAAELFENLAPLRSVGQPEEVAYAVLFLSSEKTASFITGHRLNVDGGVTL